jgi:hypothetical protein
LDLPECRAVGKSLAITKGEKIEEGILPEVHDILLCPGHSILIEARYMDFGKLRDKAPERQPRPIQFLDS